MKWFYADAGRRQIGPIEESALDDLVRAGVVRDDTLVWHEGMPDWQSHASVRGARRMEMPAAPMPSYPAAVATEPLTGPVTGSGASASASPVTEAAQGYCVECGRPFPMSEMVDLGSGPVCALCKPIHLQRVREGGVAVTHRRYAGFWIRFVARMIDGVIMGVVGLIIRLPLMLLFGLGARDAASAVAALPAMVGLFGVLALINIALAVAYEVYFVSSKGATLGKQALGLKIIRADGGPVSVNLAVGRYFAMWISSIILAIGYIMAAFDPEKRALHDRICDTRVIFVR